MKEDNSQSWVRISYGTIRYVNNYIKYNTQSLASPQEEEAEPASSEVIAARSKAKAKPQPRESSGTTTIPFNERIWIDIVPSKQDFDSHILSKRVINLLRHNQKVNREQDGAVQFYKIKFLIRDYSLSTQNWSDNRWLACLAAGGGPKRRYQYCSDSVGSIIYLRALQGHSGGRVSTYRRIWIFFLVIMKSVTADGSLRSQTGCVEGLKLCTSYSRTNDYVKLWLRHCVQLYAQQHHA